MLDISMEELRAAVFDMNPNKSLGVDGFPVLFFQKAWQLVKYNLLSLVQAALRDGEINPALNRTLVVLIPKISGPERISQFRSISLCTVPLKIITKLLVDRLRPLLDNLVSRSQSSFVPGRHTTDNIIVVQEAIHTMRTMKRKGGAIAIKVDLEKAYDRIKWSFLQQVLEEIQLPPPWVKLIMHIVSSNTFSLLWNGQQLPFFSSSRGIRQGDPLSPYLFILCLEKLGHLIDEEVRLNRWKSLQITQRGPSLSHVCFADDLVLFGEASFTQLDLMMKVLNDFCEASGEKVSLAKSKLLVSSDISHPIAMALSNHCGIALTEDFGKYLGVTVVSMEFLGIKFVFPKSEVV
ncbi:reverse transcriptase [Corchorus olitorius]|uniref:Reverse transcriptase n=1 Tax=Corchorus olitorius TaxID=93759 RepID=A0A1R3IMZ5_9ROSI|nr:reverse transcriptase [Corchorus olitorius]